MSEDLLAAIDVKLEVFANNLRGEMRTQSESLGQRIDDLDRHMHVLHEDTIDKIKALAPDFAPTERKIKEGDDGLREEFDRRLRPLEREHRKHR